MGFQAEKETVIAMQSAVEDAPPDAVAVALAPHVAEDWAWHGMHPWDRLTGAAAVAEAFWAPLKAALTPLQRRRDVFFAGTNAIDDHASTWVVDMGHLAGNLDGAWLGLGPTRRLAFLRYAEFHRVCDGRVAETAQYVDVMGVMAQVGSPALPEPTGAHLLTPGPRGGGGVLRADADPAEGPRTLARIEAMLGRLIGGGVRTTADDLAQDWARDMLWWGPAGIGASYTQARYLDQHTGPFEDGLEFVRHNGHQVRCAEGAFGAFFGYPSMTLRPTGGFLGLTSASDREADMRIVDVYRREGDLLAENWIFIDHLHFLHMLGVDLLARHRRLTA